MSEAERLERAARGPHKTSVDIYGIDGAGDQQQVLVTDTGKVITRITALDAGGIQRTILVTPEGKLEVDLNAEDAGNVQRKILCDDQGRFIVVGPGVGGVLEVNLNAEDVTATQRKLLCSPEGKLLGRTEPLIQSEYDSAITRDANDYITQIVIADGVRTKTIVVTRNANNRITALDETVV